MRLQLSIASLLIAFGASLCGAGEVSQSSPLGLAARYLEAREATMQQGALPADVEAALVLCSETLVYEHPRVGIRMEGLDSSREGMLRFLGTTRNARIKVTATLPGRDVVAVQTDVAFEGKEGAKWVPVQRQQLWVFEIADGKIQRIIEYW
ncbi:MAG: nuclear transport factor 2 family protein [Woeseiaceae bacterium]